MATLQRFQKQPAAVVSDEKIAIWFHRLFAFLLGAAFALELAALFAPAHFSDWPETTLILLATISTVASLARQLPLQNVLLAALVIALVGGGAHALGVITAIPFGPFNFGTQAGPQFFRTLPWEVPLIWIVAILNSRGVARLILRPWRKIPTYGFWLIGFTAILMVLFDFALEPFAARVKHYWLWSPTKSPVAWYGASPVNFIGWAVVSILILAFVTPALINKQPGKKSSKDFHPFVVWLGAILIFGVASGLHGLWTAVGVDAIIGIVVTIFAIRGAQW
jgi:uncharacterized membrane protein